MFSTPLAPVIYGAQLRSAILYFSGGLRLPADPPLCWPGGLRVGRGNARLKMTSLSGHVFTTFLPQGFPQENT